MSESSSDTPLLDARAEAREFHLREYDALRSEILAHSASVITLAQYAVAASAAVYVFLLTAKIDPHLEPGILSWAGFIPVMFAVFGALLSDQQHRRMVQIGRYLAKLEERLGHGDLGWERSLPQLEPWRKTGRRLGLYGSWLWFWATFTALTVALGCIGLWMGDGSQILTWLSGSAGIFQSTFPTRR